MVDDDIEQMIMLQIFIQCETEGIIIQVLMQNRLSKRSTNAEGGIQLFLNS